MEICSCFRAKVKSAREHGFKKNLMERSMDMIRKTLLRPNSRSTDKEGNEGKNKKGKEVSPSKETILPEELVERILAMVPFPYFFKARVLSKSWHARFLSISSLQEDEEKKYLASSFQNSLQNRMREGFAKWKTFCPVAYCEENLVGYDLTSCTWQRLPSLSFLPQNVLRGLEPRLELFDDMRLVSRNLQIDGALVLLTIWPNEVSDYCNYDLYVANILTQSWRKLPPRPHGDSFRFPSCIYRTGDQGRDDYFPGDINQRKLVSLPSDATYKVITVCCHISHDLIQIYNSSCGAWSSKKVRLPERLPAAYLEGILYTGANAGTHLDQRRRFNERAQNSILRLLALNVAEETTEELNMQRVEGLPVPEGFAASDFWHLLASRPWHSQLNGTLYPIACNAGRLLIVARDGEMPIQVLKVELGIQKSLDLVTSVPKRALGDSFFYLPVSDGDWIFFGVSYDSHLVVGYNMHDDKWVSVPFAGRVRPVVRPRRGEFYRREKIAMREGKDVYHWIGSPFRPSLNPFAPV